MYYKSSSFFSTLSIPPSHLFPLKIVSSLPSDKNVYRITVYSSPDLFNHKILLLSNSSNIPLSSASRWSFSWSGILFQTLSNLHLLSQFLLFLSSFCGPFAELYIIELRRSFHNHLYAIASYILDIWLFISLFFYLFYIQLISLAC